MWKVSKLGSIFLKIQILGVREILNEINIYKIRNISHLLILAVWIYWSGSFSFFPSSLHSHVLVFFVVCFLGFINSLSYISVFWPHIFFSSLQFLLLFHPVFTLICLASYQILSTCSKLIHTHWLTLLTVFLCLSLSPSIPPLASIGEMP